MLSMPNESASLKTLQTNDFRDTGLEPSKGNAAKANAGDHDVSRAATYF